MVYARRIKRFRRSRKPRRSTRKVSSSVKSYVRKAISKNIEHKYLDTTYTTAVTTTPVFQPLNLMSQGTTSSTRVGEKITMKSVQVKGMISNQDANNNTYVLGLIYDKQANGAVPTNGDIFIGNSYQGSLRDPNWRRRFKVLSMKFFDLSPVSVDDKGLRIMNIYHKFYLPTMFQGNAGTIADITSGSLILYLCSSDASGGVNTTLNCRIRYIDA